MTDTPEKTPAANGLRVGSSRAAIRANESGGGPFLSVIFSRLYRTNGGYCRTSSCGPNDRPHLVMPGHQVRRAAGELTPDFGEYCIPLGVTLGAAFA